MSWHCHCTNSLNSFYNLFQIISIDISILVIPMLTTFCAFLLSLLIYLVNSSSIFSNDEHLSYLLKPDHLGNQTNTQALIYPSQSYFYVGLLIVENQIVSNYRPFPDAHRFQV
ncbi:UNVERIFIED_CONTAM: hypothetical protein RMT77_018323 [Armadillidium vulgare]